MPKRILIVDDDEDIRDIIRDILEPEGYTIFTVPGITDIFNTIRQVHPDMILLDFMLEEENGGDFCYQVKQNAGTAHIPVILLSAYPNIVNSRGHYGWDKFIAKPFDIEYLKTTIAKLLSREPA
jgi:DNA-binding response OmpR family regulator